jgi:hypothetical protein
MISDRGNILMFDKGVGLDLRNEPQDRCQGRSKTRPVDSLEGIGYTGSVASGA